MMTNRVLSNAFTWLVVAVACLSSSLRADVLTFNITGGTLTLSGDATVAGVGTFAYTPQALNSLTTSYSGSFLVDVNNAFAPTTIAFNSATVDANVSGLYSPNNAGDSQTPQEAADYGVRVNAISANGKLRNIAFNVNSGSTTVNAGNFSVTGQSWSYTAGNIDVYSDALTNGTSSTLTGSGNNTNATLGSYSVVGNTATLTIPVTISIAYNLPGSPAVNGFNNYSGTLTAIAAVPEPSAILLTCAGFAVAGIPIARRRIRLR
jgi:hypothetical protein